MFNGSANALIGAATPGAATSLFDRAVPLILTLLSLPALFSLSLYALFPRKGSKSGSKAGSLSAWLASAGVRHARFIPVGHAFAYPALYAMLELGALERGECDAPAAFAWKGELHSAEKRRHWLPSLTAVRPIAHLHLALPQLSEPKRTRVEGSILAKLAYELRERGYVSSGPQDASWTESAPELGQAWMVCMPSLIGMQGINPLTIYYVHKPSTSGARGDFWLAVLEVHNTFAERHVYVLEVGQNEEDLPAGRSGLHRGQYEHSWLFPRAFHVSPFNDRGGWYRLLLRPLWPSGSREPCIDVRLVLMSAGEEADAPLRKKLFATLQSRSVEPLGTGSMLRAVARQPVDLLMPILRILRQAYTLHYKKRLSVFPRPEPREAKSAAVPPPNDVQEARLGVELGPGSVAWLPETGAERGARLRLEAFAKRRAEKGAGLRVVLADPLAQGIDVQGAAPQLTLHARSSGVFMDLLTLPPKVAALIAVGTGRWSVEGMDAEAGAQALYEYFSVARTASTPSGWRARTARRIRAYNLAWLCRFVDGEPSKDLLPDDALAGFNPLDEEAPSVSLISSLIMAHVGARAEQLAIRYLGVHYVPGTEGWLDLARVVSSSRTRREGWDQQLGSVLG